MSADLHIPQNAPCPTPAPEPDPLPVVGEEFDPAASVEPLSVVDQD